MVNIDDLVHDHFYSEICMDYMIRYVLLLGFSQFWMKDFFPYQLFLFFLHSVEQLKRLHAKPYHFFHCNTMLSKRNTFFEESMLFFKKYSTVLYLNELPHVRCFTSLQIVLLAINNRLSSQFKSRNCEFNIFLFSEKSFSQQFIQQHGERRIVFIKY